MSPIITRVLVCVLWLTAIGAGAVVLLRYQNADGEMGSVPQDWPDRAPISRAQDRAALVMFAHPNCPCTRASIEELNRLLTRCSRPVSTHVFFLKPSHSPAEWAETGLRRNAAAIPGVSVADDVDGEVSSCFGAKTSGLVLLYDPSGRLLFKGGITSSRGHAGDNVGSDTIVAFLGGSTNGRSHTPVYGCSLTTQCSAPTTLELICGK